jgi:hypothetical protein
MPKKKPRRFVGGGFADLTGSVGPMPGYQSLTMAPKSQSGGAYGGLETVQQGSNQIGQSLQTIGDALGKPGGGQLGGGLGSVSPFGSILGGLKNILGGTPMKKGGRVKAKKAKKAYKAGGAVKSSASKRGDGCAVKGKTKGRMV